MTENIVGAVRGTDMLESFRELLAITDFDDALRHAHTTSGKAKEEFRVVIKPNMMVFINPNAYEATVTNKDLVEALVDHIRTLGFSDISICEAQHDVGRMLKNHNVRFVAEQIGYRPNDRFRIIDLTEEAVPHDYHYTDGRGKTKVWKDVVGVTWRDADFRISFAKCKTHEHDWMTLSVKNIYGCFPSSNKISKYHIRNEVWDVTARSLRSLPVHFSFIDAWIGSDGFQGYKIAHPKPLGMLFGGRDAVAVDMEVFRRAGLKEGKSKILRKAVEQVYEGVYPSYAVRGDETRFSDVCAWQNISDEDVRTMDILEEVYVAWALINLKPTAEIVDFNLFPPKNLLYRFLVWLSQKLNAVFKLTRLYRKWYGRVR
jgi:uncharacterized protein (DUF362 family)